MFFRFTLVLMAIFFLSGVFPECMVGWRLKLIVSCFRAFFVTFLFVFCFPLIFCSCFREELLSYLACSLSSCSDGVCRVFLDLFVL